MAVMTALDVFLTLLIPTLVLVHLVVSPYTKVEESFNIQAVHDVLVYGTPTTNVAARLHNYDHFEFPGAVPRTFVGAVGLAGVARPILNFVGWQYAQHVVRAALGLFNAWSLLSYKKGLEKAYGKGVAVWWAALLAGQFHVLYYASRTLPNTFAFGICTLALKPLLPIANPTIDAATANGRSRLAIYLLVLAGVIFRSELAILLFTTLFQLLVQPRMSLGRMIPAGLESVAIALLVSIPIDSYHWQKLIWPELAGFYFNAVQGKSSEWGEEPWYYYFANAIPKLLLNPLAILLLLMSLSIRQTKVAASRTVNPVLAFIAIYSLQPHKEARFIIYAVPPLTAAAALAANHIWTHRARTIFYRLLSFAVLASIPASMLISTVMLAISSLNYPGGEALWKLHELVARDSEAPARANVHMDVLSCMTGVTRFQQDHPSPPLLEYLLDKFLPVADESPVKAKQPTVFNYDKTENETVLLTPEFWQQFDYVLAEGPERVIGKWEVVGKVWGYGGIEILKPGDEVEQVGSEAWCDLWWNLCQWGGWDKNAAKIGSANYSVPIYGNGGLLGENGPGELDDEEMGSQGKGLKYREMPNLRKMAFLREQHGSKALFDLGKELARGFVTRGWWVGPRLVKKIEILKRIPL